MHPLDKEAIVDQPTQLSSLCAAVKLRNGCRFMPYIKDGVSPSCQSLGNCGTVMATTLLLSKQFFYRTNSHRE